MAGHAKPTTTLKHYSHWLPRADKSFADRLDARRGLPGKRWSQPPKITPRRFHSAGKGLGWASDSHKEAAHAKMAKRFTPCPHRSYVLRSVATLAASESSKTSARWFLLVPPFVLGNPPGPLQLKAPLGQWTELDSTETAADCDEQRNNMTRMYQSADTTSTTIQFGLLLYHYALCVPSADPRLRLGHRNHRLARNFTGLTGGNRGTIGLCRATRPT